MGFLTELTGRIRRELLADPLDASVLMGRALAMPPARDFEEALRARTPAVIAEVKRASPAAGAIANVDPIAQAKAYEAGGASAISVLTEPRHFDGSLADLRAVRTAVRVPVLRKDFLVDPAQVIEARANGADAVLLIAACLTDAELRAMLAICGDLAVGTLVETHGDLDLGRALATEARVIGVNARDLETLEVDEAGALARLGRIPADRLAVMESGLATREQVCAALDAGASAILVGEALMRAADPEMKVRELAGEETQR
jgi:indole-3-glycerol phosphate synthase